MNMQVSPSSIDEILDFLAVPENTEYNRLLSLAERLYDENRLDEILNIPSERITDNVRKLQHLMKVTDFFDRPEDSPLTKYIQENYSDFPSDFNFSDSAPDPSISNSMVSSLLSTVFRVKYNQILKVMFEGYSRIVNIEGQDSDIYQNIDDILLVESDNAFRMFMNKYVNGNTLHDLLSRLNRVYRNDEGSVMLVRYIPASTDSSQISKEQINDLVAEVRSINKQLYSQDLKIDRVMVIAFDRLSSHASTMMSNLSYYTMSTGDSPDSPVIEYRIKYELFYYNEMMYNILKSSFVPVHQKLSEDEVQELFRRTGWNREILQSISYEDPVVVYHGFKVDDVLRIYRKSHTNTELARYSVAYRVVTPTPLFVNMDDSKSNRFIDMMV